VSAAHPREAARDIARRVIAAEAQAIAGLAERLDENFDRAVEAVAACTGRVVLLGVGKSGLVCRKIAATFSSTGTPALFVHPGEAMHGDLGGIAPGDVAICASQSGESEELVRLLPLIRQVASHVVALTGDRSSTLARAADSVLDTHVAEEACPLGLAPTASSTATLAMGDALAMAVLDRKGFSPEDFGRIHPGGSLGRRFLRVADLMKSGDALPLVPSSMPLRDVIHVMTSKGLGMTTVVDEGRLVGVFSDGDLRRLLERDQNPLSRPIGEVMTSGARIVSPELLALRAVELMEAPPRRVMWLVVQDDAGVVRGVLHMHDVMQVRR
jgi:arabinose-5-phosphate isomerase